MKSAGEHGLILFYGFSETTFPNLGIGYLASILRKFNYNYEYQYLESFSDVKAAAEEICKIKPDILGLTVTSLDFKKVEILVEHIREEYDPVVLLGGAHITSVPETLPRNVDVGFMGEAEESFLDVINLIGNGKLSKENLAKIKGILYHDREGKLIINENRQVVRELDNIPHPAREIFSRKYWETGNTGIITSRGCPYRCSYCQVSVGWRICRYHSAEYVVEEIKELVEKYNISTLGVVDDLFIVNKKRIIEITKGLKDRGLLGKVRFGVNGRANLIDDELVEILIEMGTVEIALGLESMSPNILPLLKDKVTVEDNIKAVETIYRHGLRTGGLFMIGTPTETIDDIADNYLFVKENRQKFGSLLISVTTPLPKTKLWDLAVERKLIDPDISKMDWDNLDLVGLDMLNNIYIGDIPKVKFTKIFNHFQKMFYNYNIFNYEQDNAGENDALYSNTIDSSNADLYCRNIEIIDEDSGRNKLLKINSGTKFRMVGLFNNITLNYKTVNDSVPNGISAAMNIDGQEFLLNGTAGEKKEIAFNLNRNKKQNRIRVIKDISIIIKDKDPGFMLSSIKTDYFIIEDNFIDPRSNFLKQSNSGFHQVEFSSEGTYFWTNGDYQAYLKYLGNEEKIRLHFHPGKKLDPESRYNVILELSDIKTGEMIVSKFIDVEQSKWHIESVGIPSLSDTDVIKLNLRSDTFVPKVIDNTMDTRILGIVIKSIRLT